MWKSIKRFSKQAFGKLILTPLAVIAATAGSLCTVPGLMAATFACFAAGILFAKFDGLSEMCFKAGLLCFKSAFDLASNPANFFLGHTLDTDFTLLGWFWSWPKKAWNYGKVDKSYTPVPTREFSRSPSPTVTQKKVVNTPLPHELTERTFSPSLRCRANQEYGAPQSLRSGNQPQPSAPPYESIQSELPPSYDEVTRYDKSTRPSAPPKEL